MTGVTQLHAAATAAAGVAEDAKEFTALVAASTEEKHQEVAAALHASVAPRHLLSSFFCGYCPQKK